MALAASFLESAEQYDLLDSREWLDSMREELERSMMAKVLVGRIGEIEELALPFDIANPEPTKPVTARRLSSAKSMRRWGSVPTHMHDLPCMRPDSGEGSDVTSNKGGDSSDASQAPPSHGVDADAKSPPAFALAPLYGSQRNLTSFCSEMTLTPNSSVPDLLEYERKAHAGDAKRGLLLGACAGGGDRSREEALLRYKRKRINRCFRKKVRYECRKRIASDRPRVGGRFARSDDSADAELDLAKYINVDELSPTSGSASTF